jgi:Zn-dependent protease with chaperone function
MPDISFDFQAYIDQRKGADDALARSGAAYAYPGDQRVLRTLSRVRPVTLAVEAAVRLQKSLLKSEVLGTTVKVTERQFPELYQICVACASRLHIPIPTVYVAPEVGALNAHTFGTNEDSFIVLNGVLVDHLSDEELHFVIGHECGHIQNNHVVFMTALYYLTYSANLFICWIVTPAVMALQSWSRRAEITCDRAGLLCCGDLRSAQSALTHLALGSHRLSERVNMEEYLKQLDEGMAGAGKVMELFRSHPYLPKRVQALRLFAETHYYQKAVGQQVELGEGQSLGWCDARVKRLVSIFADRKGGEPPQQPPRQEAPKGGDDA